MKAIIIATGHLPESDGLNRGLFTPMAPLVDRPFVQHVVEYIIASGASELHIVLCNSPERVERHLGDGTRWGKQIRYHLVSDPQRPYEALRYMALEDEPGPVLLAHADRLPQAVLAADRETLCPPPLLYCRIQAPQDQSGVEVDWSGWAWVSGECLAKLPLDGDWKAVERALIRQAGCKGRQVAVDQVLDGRSYEGLLAAHRCVMTKRFEGLMIGGREVDEGIWLSRNVSLHPRAQLHPPVYIGENCRIGAGVDLGPHAVVGRDCVLDKGCKAENALIYPSSYVGESLELVDVAVDKNRLVNVRLQAIASVVDDFILGSIDRDHLRPWIGRLVSRAVALGLLAVLWPVLLLTVAILAVGRKGPVVHRRDVVRLPALFKEADWTTFKLLSFASDPPKSRFKHLLLHFLPALINIARGELRFVGVPPRTKEQIKGLQFEWRNLYLAAKSGIIDEAYLQYGTASSEDEKYAAEAYYTVTAGLRGDLKLVLRYCFALLPGVSPGQQPYPGEIPGKSNNGAE